jgi:hypothetical protein
MKHYNNLDSQMSAIALMVALFLLVFFVLPSCSNKPATVECAKYYDGEGNSIPDTAIHLLVISQYTHITDEEQLFLNKYFYASVKPVASNIISDSIVIVNSDTLYRETVYRH